MLWKGLISKVLWEFMSDSLKSAEAGNSKGSEVEQVGQSLAWLTKHLLEFRRKGKVCGHWNNGR